MYILKRYPMPITYHIPGMSFDEEIGSYVTMRSLIEALQDNGEHNSANKVAEFLNWIKTSSRPSWFREDTYKDVGGATTDKITRERD
jgi:hypothetical protein